MRNISTRPLLVLFLLSILSLTAFGQAKAWTDGKLAGLSAKQVAELKKLNAAIGLPTYIPSGFKLKSANIEEPPAPEIIGYTLVYSKASGESFTIQSVNDGIGDVSEPKVYGRNPYFGERVQAGYGMDGDTTLFVSWISSKSKYQPKNSITQYFSLVSEKGDLSLREAVKIMASLRYLKR